MPFCETVKMPAWMTAISLGTKSGPKGGVFCPGYVFDTRDSVLTTPYTFIPGSGLFGQASVAESSVVLPPVKGAHAMPSYRIFKIAIDGHLIGPSEVTNYDSDEEVIAHAKAKLEGLDLEVWDGPR